MTDWTVSVFSAGVEYNISDAADFLLTGIDGIGHAAVARIGETGPMQHGALDLGYRLQPRRIALVVEARGGDRAEWLARRNELLSIFRASDAPLKLRLTNGDWQRQIDCYLSGEMQMAPDNMMAPVWQKFGIELSAPDPTWYDPAGASHTFALGGGGQTMNVPLAIPWQVGASAIDQSTQIAYPGTWDAWPIVTITGPATDLLIENTTLGDKLDFAGVTIGDGVVYVIDTRYGYKTVTRGDGANRVQDLTADSNLATFRIGAHPDVEDGLNSIRVRASAINAGTRVNLQYYVRYVGV